MKGLTPYEMDRIKQIKDALERQENRGIDVSGYEAVFFLKIIERLTVRSIDRRDDESRQDTPHRWRKDAACCTTHRDRR